MSSLERMNTSKLFFMFLSQKDNKAWEEIKRFTTKSVHLRNNKFGKRIVIREKGVMDFGKIARNIQKLMDVDPVLCQKLRQYCYPIVGCCQEVHNEMGPFLNEYMYQDALVFALEDAGFTGDNMTKEYYFTTKYKEHEIKHPHKVDFLVNKKVFIECKAVERLNSEFRQQLWNYMRLSGIRIGILYNFAPIKDQCERYYYDPEKQVIYAF